MKIEESRAAPLFGLHKASNISSNGRSFAELLASGRSIGEIVKSRALGFSETGIFGVYGGKYALRTAPEGREAVRTADHLPSTTEAHHAFTAKMSNLLNNPEGGGNGSAIKNAGRDRIQNIVPRKFQEQSIYNPINSLANGYMNFGICADDEPIEEELMRCSAKRSMINSNDIFVMVNDQSVAIKVNGVLRKVDQEKIRDRLKITTLYFGMSLRDITVWGRWSL